MTNAIAPALSAEEWASSNSRSVVLCHTSTTQYNDLKVKNRGYGEYPDTYEIPEGRRHRIAALCLSRQSFGFTRNDTEALRDIEGFLRKIGHLGTAYAGDIASRIEALLPPEAE